MDWCHEAVLIARSGACPSSFWHDATAPLLSRPYWMNLVHVGANKGYSVLDHLSRYKPSSWPAMPTPQEWHAELLRGAERRGQPIEFPCGYCDACHTRSSIQVPNPPTALRAFALDIHRPNVNLLSHQLASFNLSHAVRPLHLAGSNASGIVYTTDGAAGKETNSAKYGADRHGRDRKARTIEVSATSLDDFVYSHGIDRINLLHIDAEGFDALVLEGAKTLLKARLIDLIEFEYHMLGKWSLYAHDVRHLKRMLIWLDLFGYSCFWQGAKAVARASGPWWCNKMEFREHSNLVCSHLPGVLEVLRRLADDGK